MTIMYMLAFASQRYRFLPQFAFEEPRSHQRGADRLDPQPVVDLLADRVVDAADHARHAEQVLRHLRRHHVPVIALGRRHEGLRLRCRAAPSMAASLAPTRPQPMITIFTGGNPSAACAGGSPRRARS